MVFASFEELKSKVAERRESILTLEIEFDAPYVKEHEDAKAELAQAEGMKLVTGGGFLGDNLEQLRQRVAETKPETESIYIQFSKLDLDEWKKLVSIKNLDAFAQYERALPQTFRGLYGADPTMPSDWHETNPGEDWAKPEPLTMSYLSVSAAGGAESVLEGGQLHSVVQSFMSWQNSGGEVSIRPTKSGRA